MRVARIVLSLLFVAPALSSQLSSQQVSAAVQRDPQAVSALQQAIAALGGQAAIVSLQNSIAVGTITPASASSWVEAGNFKWENDFSGSSYEFRDEFEADGVTKVFASGHGNPAFNNGLQTLARSSYAAQANLPFHLPGIVLLRELSNATCAVQFVEISALSGNSVIHVHTSISGDPAVTALSQQDWYLDAVTSLPRKVTYRIPSQGNALDYQLTTIDFSNYRFVNGVAVPFTLVTSEGDATVSTATITNISFNVSIASSDFDLVSAGAL